MKLYKVAILLSATAASAATEDHCYFLKDKQDRKGLVCNKSGTPKRQSKPLNNDQIRGVDNCVQACIDWPDAKCKSIFYDYYTGCYLQSKTVAQLGVVPPSNPDEYSFVSDINCYEPYETTSILNGQFDDGETHWSSRGLANFKQGKPQIKKTYPSDKSPTQAFPFELSQGGLRLCPGKGYFLHFTQQLLLVQGNGTFVVTNQVTNATNPLELYYDQEKATSPPQPQALYVPADGSRGDVWSVAFQGVVAAAGTGPSGGTARTLFSFDNFTLVPNDS